MLSILSAASAASRQVGAGVPVGLADDAGASADLARVHAEAAVPLWRYVYRTCGNAATADDVVQESFLRLLARPKILVDPAIARPYLYRIASNLIRDRWRKRPRRLLDKPASRFESDPATRDRVGHERDVRVRRDVQAVLDQLNRRERALVWLAHVDGYRHREIAEILGLRTASVKVLLHRAKTKLTRLLEDHGYTPGAPR